MDDASLFLGPSRAGGCRGQGWRVVPFGGEDIHGQRCQRCEVVTAATS